MNVTIPPTEGEINIAAIKRAMDSKQSEVEQTQRKLSELQAEWRGLKIALDALGGNVLVPRK